MNRQSWTADEGWTSTLIIAQITTNATHYEMLHRPPSNLDKFFGLAERQSCPQKLRYGQITTNTVHSLYKCALYRQTTTLCVASGFNSIIDEDCILRHSAVLIGKQITNVSKDPVSSVFRVGQENCPGLP